MGDFSPHLLMLHTKYARLKSGTDPLFPNILGFIDDLREVHRKGRKRRKDFWFPLTSPRLRIASAELLKVFGGGIGINTHQRKERVLAGLERLLEMDRQFQDEFESFCEMYFKLKEGGEIGARVLEIRHET